MYKINKSSNSIEPLEEKSFSSLGFRERDHLQEWVLKKPDVLGEPLLIIQKEFAGFEDTRERLDLLALDKKGALVIIENKLDDSGRDVTWQAMKYASYCSGLSKASVTKIYQQYLDGTEPGASAEERISDFMDGQAYEEIVLNKSVTQRIILVAAKFRKEVTSTVLWLMNFNVRLQCFRATPYASDEGLFLKFDQIIPIQDAEEYMIGMAEKTQDEIKSSGSSKNGIIYREFWAELIEAIKGKESNLYQHVNPRPKNRIYSRSLVPGVRFQFTVIKDYGFAELYIKGDNKEENEFIFDELRSQKEKVEAAFRGPLVWERLDEKRPCRIKAERPGNIFDKEQWESMIESMTDAMCRLEKAFKAPLLQVGEKLKSGETTTV